MRESTLDKYERVAVIGLGKSGVSALRLLSHLNKKLLVINQGEVDSWFNQASSYVDRDNCVSQSEANLKEIDLVILSPGIPRDIDLLKEFKGDIYCEIELASWFVDSPIVAITGTNGKTTTVSLIEEALKTDGRDYFVGGNIGIPFCDYAYELLTNKRNKAWLVALELSSFQLESLNSFSPLVSAVLNITFSHGERYDHLDEYALAKRNIFNNVTKTAISPVNLWSELKLDPPSFSNHIEIDPTKAKEEVSKLLDIRELKIYGEHNLQNIFFANRVWIEAGGDKETFIKACKSFTGVEYRCQFLGDFDGVKVFNDAKSTNWDATVTALDAVKDQGRVNLILGGQLRGEGDFQLERLNEFKDSISKILFIGESGLKLFEMDSDFDGIYIGSIDQIKDHLDCDVLLFSPGFPSFDQYRNYVERGSSFTKIFKTI